MLPFANAGLRQGRTPSLVILFAKNEPMIVVSLIECFLSSKTSFGRTTQTEAFWLKRTDN